MENINEPNEILDESNPKAENFVGLRNQRDEARRINDQLIQQNEEMMKRFDALESRLNYQQNPQTSHKEMNIYEKYGLEPGGLIETEKLLNVLEKEKRDYQEGAKNIAKQTYEEMDRSRFNEKLSTRYQDYDEVMTKENLSMLNEEDPYFAAAINNNPDPYAKRELAYKKIKELNSKRVRTSAQTVVAQNKKGSYYYTPSGGDMAPSAAPMVRSYTNNESDRLKAWSKLQQNKKRIL